MKSNNMLRIKHQELKPLLKLNKEDLRMKIRKISKTNHSKSGKAVNLCAKLKAEEKVSNLEGGEKYGTQLPDDIRGQFDISQFDFQAQSNIPQRPSRNQRYHTTTWSNGVIKTSNVAQCASKENVQGSLYRPRTSRQSRLSSTLAMSTTKQRVEPTPIPNAESIKNTKSRNHLANFNAKRQNHSSQISVLTHFSSSMLTNIVNSNRNSRNFD